MAISFVGRGDHVPADLQLPARGVRVEHRAAERHHARARPATRSPGWREQPWNNLFLMVIMVWMQTGFAMVVLSAAIKADPRRDHRGRAHRRRIGVPGLPARSSSRPSCPRSSVVGTYMVINALKVFDIVFVMGNAEANGTEVIAERMIRWFFIGANSGRGAAIAVVLFVVVIPVMVWNVRRFREAGGRSDERPRSSDRRWSCRRRRRRRGGRPSGEVRQRRLVRPHHDHRRRRDLADPHARCAGHVVPARGPRQHDGMVDGARPPLPCRRRGRSTTTGRRSIPAGFRTRS